MSTRVAWTVLALWPVTGLLVSYVMRRRGHELFSWGVLGVVFGPLTIVLAVDHARAERTAEPRVLREGRPGAGPVSILIGVDGSAEADAAARTALYLFGPRAGRVTVARALDYETVSEFASVETARERERIEADFAAEVQDVAGPDAEAHVLVGNPAEALIDAATRGEFDLVVVAPRGRSASRALLGSTAAHLVRACPVPVLVVGPSLVAERATGWDATVAEAG